MHFLSFIQILSQVAPPEDDIFDIVVLEPRESLTGFVFWLFVLLILLVAAGIAAWLTYRKNRNREPANAAEIRVTQKFRRLRVDREHLEPNQFTQRLSDALKDYLAEKFKDPVRFETTQEFLQRVSKDGSALPPAARESLASFLVSSDEVKFANLSDAEERAEPLLDQAAVIVKQCQIMEKSD
jgi:uncharacterized protein (DUF2267 family)